jgi:hypothetical protein
VGRSGTFHPVAAALVMAMKHWGLGLKSQCSLSHPLVVQQQKNTKKTINLKL